MSGSSMLGIVGGSSKLGGVESSSHPATASNAAAPSATDNRRSLFTAWERVNTRIYLTISGSEKSGARCPLDSEHRDC
jgi:hypothetical protein